MLKVQSLIRSVANHSRRLGNQQFIRIFAMPQMKCTLTNQIVFKCSTLNDTGPNDKTPPPSQLTHESTNRLKIIPLSEYKIKQEDLTEAEKAAVPMTYCLFQSAQPIFPYFSIQCSIKIGNLKEINHPLLYTLASSDNGQLYDVGIVLHTQVEKDLKKELKKQLESTVEGKGKSQAYTVQIQTKQNNFRIKIIEVNVTPEGIFAKGIPYKDRELNVNEQSVDAQKEIEEITSLIDQIKKLTSSQLDYSSIDKNQQEEIFKEINWDLFQNLSKLKPTDFNKLAYNIAMPISKLQQTYLKQTQQEFIQMVIQAQTHIERILLIKHQLIKLKDVMGVVAKNLKDVESKLYKIHPINVARLAVQYIQSTYLKDQKPYGEYLHSGQNHQTRAQPTSLTSKYIENLHKIADPISREKVRKEIDRFAQIDKNSSEFHKINTYLDEIFSIPWNKLTVIYKKYKSKQPVEWNIDYARQILENEIQGLSKVKERIVQMIAVNKLKNSTSDSKGFIILLNGPPGTGKTSIAKAIAKSLKRESRFISCAGVGDPNFFKGHRRTYVDSQPGVFIKELIKANTMNPVFIIDEIDKISKNHSGSDPYYSLLEILNPEENGNFMDHYLDISVDFSKVIFILTANQLVHILEPLQNRLEIIEIQAYIEEEKLAIANNFIINKALESSGIKKELIKYDDSTIRKIIKGWCYYEGGVRELKRCFEKIGRKRACELINNYPELFQKAKSPEEEKGKQKEPIKKEQQIILTYDSKNIEVLDFKGEKNLELLQKYLGPPVFDANSEARSKLTFPPGQLNILTVAGMIGNVLQVECVYDESEPDKKGQLTSSGNLKNVLQESLKIAKINALNCLSGEYQNNLLKKNIHIHFLESAPPKDGPSAGTAICTALISIALGYRIPSNIAMTGEMSLNGNVCKIGGVQQKLIASKTLDIKDVILPYGNLGDALDLPIQLLNDMNIYFVSEYSQIYSLIFDEKIIEFRESHRNDISVEGVLVLKDGIMVGNQQQHLEVQDEVPNNNNVDSAESK